jgi:hypothetical protein
MPASHAGGAADSASTSKQREEKSGVLETTETLADYISKCAHLELQVPILAFPRRENGAGDFEKFTAREINGLADGAAVLPIRQGLTALSEENAVTVALLGQGSVQFVATFLVLPKLGYAVILMPPRLSASTIVGLLAKTECRLVMFT